MTALLRNPLVYAFISFTLLFTISIPVFGSGFVKDFIDYGVLAASLALFFKWFSNTVEAFNSGGNSPKSRLSLGIALIAAGLSAQRAWIIISDKIILAHWVDRQAISSYVVAWLLLAILFILSVDSPEEEIFPHLKWFYGIVGVCFGIIAGFATSRLLFP